MLLTKLDLVAADAVERVHAELHAVNGDAERASFPSGPAATAALSAFLLAPREVRRSRTRTKSHRQGQLTAVCYAEQAPLSAEPLLSVIRSWQHRLLRVKGFVWIADQDLKGYVNSREIRWALRCEIRGVVPTGEMRLY